MRLYNLPFYGVTYRAIMKLAHRFNWHYAPPIYPEGDTMLWCQWCGFRDVIKKANYRPAISNEPECVAALSAQGEEKNGR